MSRKREKAQTQGKRKGFNFLIFLLLFLSILIFQDKFIASAQETNSADELSSIEEKVFHQNYKDEIRESRISMLENFLFGKDFKAEPTESRIKKITDAISSKKEKEQPQELIIPEKVEIKDSNPEPSSREGILNRINQIETKLFNKTFENYPFQIRVSALEERILSQEEIAINKTKPLLNRVSFLLDKIGIEDSQTSIPNKIQEPQTQKSETIKTYSIDPRTNFLINEETGEEIRDKDGNKIYVKSQPTQNPQAFFPQQQALPQGFSLPFPNNQGLPINPYGNLNNPFGTLQQNPYNPYGTQQQNSLGGSNQPLPYELFLNPENFDSGNQDDQY